MLGQTFSRVLADNESVTFENDKVRYVLYHEQDCCESVVVEEIIGDIEDLENWPLLIAREDHDAATIKENYSTGKVSLVGAAIWDKEKRSQIAKSKGCGGYRPNAGHSQKYKVTDSFGNQVTLQSSYELLCAEILDNLQIKWIRPKSLTYNGKRYFPDFYLPDHDLYLDPKNDYLAKLDEQKIACVREQNSVEVVILTKEWPFYLLTHFLGL